VDWRGWPPVRLPRILAGIPKTDLIVLLVSVWLTPYAVLSRGCPISKILKFVMKFYLESLCGSLCHGAFVAKKCTLATKAQSHEVPQRLVKKIKFGYNFYETTYWTALII
jgi:hypothetical protein